MIIKVLVVGDMHVGSKYGLCPQSYFNSHTNAFQWWVLDLWHKFVSLHQHPDYLILAGDNVDGSGAKDATTLVITDVNEQEDAAVVLLRPLVGPNTEIYGVSGSGYHEGKGTGRDSDRNVTEKLISLTNSRGKHDKKYIGLLLREKYGFGNIAFRHKGKSVTATLKDEYEKIAKEYGPRSDVVVTAHLHRKLIYQDGLTVVQTPCWEYETDYMVGTRPIDIGATYIIIDTEYRTVTPGFFPGTPIPQNVFKEMNNWIEIDDAREEELKQRAEESKAETISRVSKELSLPVVEVEKVYDEIKKEQHEASSSKAGFISRLTHRLPTPPPVKKEPEYENKNIPRRLPDGF
jgi:hypothetical protein